MAKSKAAVSMGKMGGAAYREKLVRLKMLEEAGDAEAAAELEKIRERARQNGAKSGGRPRIPGA